MGMIPQGRILEQHGELRPLASIPVEDRGHGRQRRGLPREDGVRPVGALRGLQHDAGPVRRAGLHRPVAGMHRPRDRPGPRAHARGLKMSTRRSLVWRGRV